MKTKECFGCHSIINTFASKCPNCNIGPLSPGEDTPSSLNLDFFGLSLYKSTIDELTSELEAKFGKPEKILDTTYYTVGDWHFFHRLIFFGETKKLVYMSPDEQIVIPYSQIGGYIINDNSFQTGGAERAKTTTDTGSLIGRTAAGAVLGGTTGALIGGSTASKTTIFEREGITNNPRFSISIKTNSISVPIISIDFEEHKDDLQQFAAILDIILRNQSENVEDNMAAIEQYDVYLQEEIRRRHPEIVKDELEKEQKRKEEVDGNIGCMSLLIIPIVIGGLSYFLI